VLRGIESGVEPPPRDRKRGKQSKDGFAVEEGDKIGLWGDLNFRTRKVMGFNLIPKTRKSPNLSCLCVERLFTRR